MLDQEDLEYNRTGCNRALFLDVDQFGPNESEGFVPEAPSPIRLTVIHDSQISSEHCFHDGEVSLFRRSFVYQGGERAKYV